MAIKYGVWIECDKCGDGAGDAGVAIPAPFEVNNDAPQERETTEHEATQHALDNGFIRTPDGRLLCHACAEPEDDDEGDEDEDVHADCWQPHLDGNGELVDCDGRPI
jgi:hypothetical protein